MIVYATECTGKEFQRIFSRGPCAAQAGCMFQVQVRSETAVVCQQLAFHAVHKLDSPRILQTRYAEPNVGDLKYHLLQAVCHECSNHECTSVGFPMPGLPRNRHGDTSLSVMPCDELEVRQVRRSRARGAHGTGETPALGIGSHSRGRGNSGTPVAPASRRQSSFPCARE